MPIDSCNEYIYIKYNHLTVITVILRKLARRLQYQWQQQMRQT